MEAIAGILVVGCIMFGVNEAVYAAMKGRHERQEAKKPKDERLELPKSEALIISFPISLVILSILGSQLVW